MKLDKIEYELKIKKIEDNIIILRESNLKLLDQLKESDEYIKKLRN
jgi:hypothetical protein